MTWFEIYAAFGAPVFLFAICVGLVAFERKRRGHLSAEPSGVNVAHSLITDMDGLEMQPRLLRLFVEADANLARQAELTAALHAEIARKSSDPRSGVVARDR